ncbi:radical SAM protein [Micromonospora narathiwatensis]|uniref:Radical SAM superfamily enzyme, MoaA/NifB/PqqE/SkfB family n=1 Tax=Micromonospora narathiwatensis TaxID=299146 RepID=A0A1A8ZBB0_9ACTN|nr:radical SAM protein [Micromonospora narathiwatensis]SBT41093.1 Radical SAM superfamily enzyme, MoaA/NifB/PqqE/SkfB family [Micromonospora narathiwatensis]
MTFKSLEMSRVGGGALRAIEIGVTSRCNFRCDYCGAYDLLERKILSVEDVANVIDTLPDLQRVKLSGGEVLLEFDICEGIVEYCTSKGIETQINSNGTVLDEAKFERLEAAGLGVLHFSLNHTDAAGHSAFYRVHEKMFPKIVAAISRSVASSSIDTVIETILFDETESRMAQVHRFAADLGVRKHEIQMEIPSVHQGYENTLDSDRICSAIADLVEHRDPRTTLFFSCLSAYLRPGSDGWKRLQPLFRDPGVIYASCIEGKAQLHLHSNGDVMICELGNPDVIGNVFETDMLTMYEESPRLKAFVQSKHEDQTFSCFRHFDKPGQKVANPGGVALLGMPTRVAKPASE